MLRIPFAALLLAAGGVAPSLAQETAPAAPSGEAAVTREAIGDWTKVCAASGSPCVIEQIGKTAQGEAALNMQIERLPKAQTVNGEQVEAVANVLTPLGVLLQNGLRLQIDGGEVQASPFFLCQANGCVVRAPLRPALLTALRRGASAKMSYAGLDGTKPREVSVTLSLSGFTKAFDSIK